jgi:hypothetical protein
MFLWAAPAAAQNRLPHHGFWADVEFGYGRLAKSSDQEPLTRQGVFTLNFAVGGWLNHHLRLGGELGGWLLQGFSTIDPSIGESVSQVRVVGQWYPWPSRGLFVKAGAGRAIYTNEHPLEFDSEGWGGTIGAGYDLRVSGSFSLTPVVSFNRGSLGGVSNLVTTVRNRRYHVVDVGIALTYR